MSTRDLIDELEEIESEKGKAVSFWQGILRTVLGGSTDEDRADSERDLNEQYDQKARKAAREFSGQ